MYISLRDFKEADKGLLAGWVEAIHAPLYMSRSSPRLPVFAWYVIQVDGDDMGTVWLEKESPDDQEAVLGILIGRGDRLGQGVGRAAIRLALTQAQSRLHFGSVRLNVRKNNTRAIACYQHCGFNVSREGEGRNQHGELLQFYEMKMAVDRTPATSTVYRQS